MNIADQVNAVRTFSILFQVFEHIQQLASTVNKLVSDLAPQWTIEKACPMKCHALHFYFQMMLLTCFLLFLYEVCLLLYHLLYSFLDIKQFLPMVLTVSSLKSGNKESKTAGQLTVSKFHVQTTKHVLGQRRLQSCLCQGRKIQQYFPVHQSHQYCQYYFLINFNVFGFFTFIR